MSRVILLGAGASADAQVPTTLDMTEAFLKMSREDMQEPMAQYVLHYVAGTMYSAAIRHLADPKAFRLNVEILIRTVKSLAERNSIELEPFVHAWARQVDAIDKSVLSWDGQTILANSLGEMNRLAENQEPDLLDSATNLHHVYTALALDSGGAFWKAYFWMLRRLVHLTVIDHAARVNYYHAFVRKACDQQVPIATLNYDNAVELACQTVAVPCDNGMRAWLDDGFVDFDAKSLKLLKLHGSVLWSKKWVNDQEVPSNDWADLEADTTELLKGTEFPEIIFGERNKLAAAGPMLELFEEFRTELSLATELHTIGYSFNDEHVNALIARWMRFADGHLHAHDIRKKGQTSNYVSAVLRLPNTKKLTCYSERATVTLGHIFD